MLNRHILSVWTLEKGALLHIVNTFRIEVKDIWARSDTAFVKKVLHVFIAVQLLCIKFYLFAFSNAYLLFVNNKLANFCSFITLPLVFGLADRGVAAPIVLYLLLILESTIFYYILKSVPGAQE